MDLDAARNRDQCKQEWMPGLIRGRVLPEPLTTSQKGTVLLGDSWENRPIVTCVMKSVLNFTVVWGLTPSSLINTIKVSENYYVSVLRVKETHFYAEDGGSTSFRKFVQTIVSVREQC